MPRLVDFSIGTFPDLLELLVIVHVSIESLATNINQDLSFDEANMSLALSVY